VSNAKHDVHGDRFLLGSDTGVQRPDSRPASDLHVRQQQLSILPDARLHLVSGPAVVFYRHADLHGLGSAWRGVRHQWLRHRMFAVHDAARQLHGACYECVPNRFAVVFGIGWRHAANILCVQHPRWLPGVRDDTLCAVGRHRVIDDDVYYEQLFNLSSTELPERSDVVSCGPVFVHAVR